MTAAISIFHDPDEAGCFDGKSLDWLLELGVTINAITSPWCIRASRVVFDNAGRYEPCPGVGDFTFVFGIHLGEDFHDLELIDNAAWSPATGRIATRLGVGACLGEGQIGRNGMGTTGRRLPVWRTPLGWLQNNRCGIVVVDHVLAAHRLAGVTIRAEDRKHAAELGRTLKVPPVILTHERIAA